MNNGWILEEVIESLRLRLNTLQKMMQDEGFMPIYKVAMKQEIIWLENELNEIDQMLLEDVRESELADEDYRENRAYSQI